MAGTKIGGLKAKKKNLTKNPDFYKKIGSIGGRNSKTGGFASDLTDSNGMTGRDRASIQGAVGGRKSRRKKSV